MAYINGIQILFSPQIKITSGGIIPSGTEYITKNGTYDVSDKASVEVNVEGGGAVEAVLIEKEITANGEYNASDDGADGYSKVIASVPEAPEWDGSYEITSEGA